MAKPKKTFFAAILALAFLPMLWSSFSWLFWDANFSATTGRECSDDGACWAFIGSRWSQFMVGFYPTQEMWRIYAFASLIIPGLAWILWPRAPFKKTAFITFYVLTPLLTLILLHGGYAFLPLVPTDKWGGLLLTLLVSLYGIAFALLFGILLALARRSALPLLRLSATGLIEFCRAVPLITLLFMSSVMLPYFLPTDLEIDKLWRALFAIVIFGAAYVAEVVRGGIQAIPKGQFEAASALGLSGWQAWTTVILPQALRHVIPALTNTMIGLFKDTSLVLVIGMFDLLGMIQAASSDPEWLGFALEGYIFAALIYFVGCSAISWYSRRLEQRLSYR